MKGVSLLSDLFMIFALISTIVIITTITWLLILAHEAEARLYVASPRNVELRLFTLPLKYDATLLSFLEYEKHGISVKRLMEAASIQKSTTVWLDGESVDVTSVADEFLKPLVDKDYILKIVYPDSSELKISELVKTAQLPSPLPVQRSSIELFLLDGKTVQLQLFVKGW